MSDLELPLEWLGDLRDTAREFGLDLWLTPFAPDLVKECAFHANVLKVASGDITYQDLLTEIKRWNMYVPIAISTGASEAEEIGTAVKTLLPGQLILLNCVSRYPATKEMYDLTCLPYSDMVQVRGVSDHTPGTELIAEAIERGYLVFEKHFHIPGTPSDLPDRMVSLDPEQFKVYVEEIQTQFTLCYRMRKQGSDWDERIWARRSPDGLRPAQ